MSDYFLTSATVSTRGQRFSVYVLALFGWRVNFRPVPGPHGVIIVYPHTSNWDFPLGLLAKWAMGMRIRWLAKDSLFRGLTGAVFGPLFRRWGGEPIERSTSTGAIERFAGRMKTEEHFWLALAPEGTRTYRSSWRSGFYHIALIANVPLGIASIDYSTRQIRLVDYVMLTGDKNTDIANIRAAYQGCTGLRPQCASPIDFNTMRSDAVDQRQA